MGNILIISYSKFPDGDARSIREYGFGRLLENMGHKILFIGMGETPYSRIELFKGFKYVSLRINQNKKSLPKKLVDYFGYKHRLKQFIMRYSIENKIDTILIGEIPLNALFFIKRLVKKNNIKLVHDCVEWYSPEQFKLKKLSPGYILNDLYNRFFIDRKFKVIAISKYLEDHFRLRKIETIRIPVIIDVNEIHFEKDTNKNKVTILYAGSPGKKDYLKLIIEGIILLNYDEQKKIELRLIGVTREYLKDELDMGDEMLNTLKNNIKIFGFLPRKIVLENLKKADFTVLLRSPAQRYAKAGFPTKVVESLASGTPVILNITSDLGDYITDMEQGLIVPDCSSSAFCYSLRRAINLTFDKRCEMYAKARICAEKYFHYEKYEKILSKIIY